MDDRMMKFAEEICAADDGCQEVGQIPSDADGYYPEKSITYRPRKADKAPRGETLRPTQKLRDMLAALGPPPELPEDLREEMRKIDARFGRIA